MISNQSPIFAGHNTYQNDPLLLLATSAFAPNTKKEMTVLGEWTGSKQVQELANIANLNPPILKTHDAKGNRIDQIDHHPSYHAFMRKGVAQGLHASVWEKRDDEKGQRNLLRASRLYLTAGTDIGHLNALSVTNASVAALLTSPKIAQEWLSLITSRQYDSSSKTPISKKGLLFALAVCEKQTSSYFNGLETVAESINDGTWRITGHKWFVSAPMADAYLVLAKTPKGPSLFLMPRVLSDQVNNKLSFQRLKQKVGNNSLATAEVEFDGAVAQLVGGEGKGAKALEIMQGFLHLDSAIIKAGLMRKSLAEAVHHCRHRSSAKGLLIEQPIMQRVLADMALDVGAAMLLSFRLAQSFDRAAANSSELAYRQIMTPIIKYWTGKLAPSLISEAMECLGGNGYVQESNLARHYQDAPFNGMWESPGNIVCLSALQTIKDNPEQFESVLDGLKRDLGGEGAEKTVNVIRTAAVMASQDEGSARILVEQLALTAAAAELKRIGLAELSDAFIETRLGGLWRTSYGMLDSRQNAPAIIKALYL